MLSAAGRLLGGFGLFVNLQAMHEVLLLNKSLGGGGKHQFFPQLQFVQQS